MQIVHTHDQKPGLWFVYYTNNYIIISSIGQLVFYVLLTNIYMATVSFGSKCLKSQINTDFEKSVCKITHSSDLVMF